MRDDTHWSPAGSQAVANAIAKRLTNRTVTNAKVTTTRHEVKTYDGDLLAYVPTGILRPLIGPAQNNITRFETHVDTGNDLFGNAPVDIVLVGTSFSAKEDWHFEGFLKQALQADILNFAQQGQGPFAPMKDFLASDHFKNTPPKIVIWEIPMRYMSKDHEK